MEETLSEIAERCDRAVINARAELVAAIRRSHRQGLTQKQIASATGRSQPEIHRLLRFHGLTPLGRTVMRNRGEIIRVVEELGGNDVRIFGSVADGTDEVDSDVDVLYTPGRTVSMMTLAKAQRQISELIGAAVELVSDADLAPYARQTILDQAVPL